MKKPRRALAEGCLCAKHRPATSNVRFVPLTAPGGGHIMFIYDEKVKAQRTEGTQLTRI